MSKARDEVNKEYRERYKKRLKIKNCEICGVEFKGRDKQKNCPDHAHKTNTNASIKKRRIKVCGICGKEFYGKLKFCSKDCYNRYVDSLKKEKIEKKCGNCGEIIYVYPSLLRDNNFCSKSCFYEYKLNKPNFKIRKEKHPQWKGGTEQRSTTTIKYKKWRRDVFRRDGYVCRFCGSSNDIVVHHIVAWADDVTLRFYKTNGITLCSKCHEDIHDKNFMKPIDYEKTKDKCQEQGVKLRKEVSNRIEGLISERRNRNSEKFK